MSTDPLGEALGTGEPSAAPQDGQAAGPSSQAGPESGVGAPAASGYRPPEPYRSPSPYDGQPAEAAWSEPQPERSLLERRPEIMVGAAMAGGFIAAQVLGRIRGR